MSGHKKHTVSTSVHGRQRDGRREREGGRATERRTGSRRRALDTASLCLTVLEAPSIARANSERSWRCRGESRPAEPRYISPSLPGG